MRRGVVGKFENELCSDGDNGNGVAGLSGVSGDETEVDGGEN